MSLRDLDYQARVLLRLDVYLAELTIQKKRADGIAALAEQQPDLGLEIPDFPLKTWEALKAAGKLPESRMGIPYSPRADGIGRAVPNIIYKVPTGGGKTYLAVTHCPKSSGGILASIGALFYGSSPTKQFLHRPSGN